MTEPSPSPPAAGAPSSPAASSDRTTIALVVVLGILWGSAFPVIHAGIDAGAPPLYFASVRYLLTAAALAPIALARRSPMPTRSEIGPPLLLGGVLMIGLYGALLYLGEQTTSGGVAAILTASVPLVSAVLAYRLLPAERFGRWGTIGLVVGFGGVAVLVLPQLGGSTSSGFVGPLLVVGAVVSFAIGSVILRRTSHVAPGLWLLTFQFAVAGALVGVFGAVSGEPTDLGALATVLPALAFLVIFTGILGYSLYFRIHHTAGPTRANLVGYVNPVTGVVVGLVVFGEAVSAVEIGGLALIAGGLYLLGRDRRRAG